MTAKRTRARRLLVVDDDAAVVEYLVEALVEHGYEVHGMSDARAALARIGRESFDMVIADVEMPGLRGIDLLARIGEQKPDQLVLLITAFGSIEMAVDAVRAGAVDFVTKPFRIEALVLAMERAFRERSMRREIVRLRRRLAPAGSGALVASSAAMQKVVEVARRAARTSVAVLLTGESGTGKGAMARFIHEHSDRRSGPFVQVNCAALPEMLVESELFGVRRGAFTDAREDRDGLFAEASGGTLFLDEIGDMPLEAQAKLLQAIETGRIRPVGGSGELAVDVRVVAATNRPLEEALRERRFRPDLYFRINVIRIEIPPLRGRPEDIPDLADHFLARTSERLGRMITGLSDEARGWLLRHDWPGNVRELANVIERAVALSEGDVISAEDLVPEMMHASSGDTDLAAAAMKGLSLAEIERVYVRAVVDASGGNMARAAKVLGIDRRTLYRKLERKPDEP